MIYSYISSHINISASSLTHGKYTFAPMKLLLACLLIFSVHLSPAQSQLAGRVIDAQSQEVLPFASISVKNKVTKAISGAKAALNGKFEINNLPKGQYVVVISMVGYENKQLEAITITADQTRQLGDIMLVKKNQQLRKVVIEYEKKNIEIQADKKVFNVEKNIAAVGGTLEDALRNVPGVSVNADGSVALRGKSNVTILMDGKQNPLFADLATALKSIPADNIASIEVITNPSSKYEAQGLGGIINIVMKEGKKKKGFSGSLTAGAQYNWRLNAGANLNYRPNEKLGFFLNTNGGISNEWEENEYYRSIYTSTETYESNSIKYRVPRRLFASFGVEYAIDKRNVLTWTNSVFRGSFDGDDTTYIFERSNPNTLQEYWFRNNVYNAKPANTTTNLKYTRKYAKQNQQLNVEANISKRSYVRQSDFTTEVFDGQQNLLSGFVQRNPIEGGNINGAFQLDYQYPIGEKAKLEVGERTYFLNFQSENFPTIQFYNQAEQIETILKNDFNFLQQVHGLYANYSSSYQDYSFQFGLRGEYFRYNGTAAQLGNANFSTDYLSLFPSAFVSKKINSQSDLNLNYSRRVNRPDFFQLIPFIRVNSPLDTSIGNPGLNPEFIHAFELAYNKRYGKDNTFLLSAYYQLTDDIIQQYRRFNADGSTFTQTQNLAQGSTMGMELTNQYYVSKNWDVTLNANGFRNIINGDAGSNNQNFDGYGGLLKLINNTGIGQDWQLQVSGTYFAQKVIVQGKVLGYGFADLALKKSLLNKKLNITLLASDIFNTNKTTTVFDLFPQQYQRTFRNEQTRFIGINVQYVFPKTQNGRKGREAANSKFKNRDENLKGEDSEGF